MNKTEAYNLERKEYWGTLIKQCGASRQSQQDWCKENNVCGTSLTKRRTFNWLEEDASKEFSAASKERGFFRNDD